MPTPEAKAREKIDELLTTAGWSLQDRDAINLGASTGVAVREFTLSTGAADYLLFVNRQAVGAIEAKKEGVTLSGIESQSAKYSVGLPSNLRALRTPAGALPFLYESTGIETYFTNGLDPDPRSRRVFAFHKPATLAAWAAEATSMRGRLQTLPPLNTSNLWAAQVEAITNLEKSLAESRPRALIQMATGSGKTFTAVSFVYRLIKFGGARRVLFLVDRSNLGRQAEGEFKQYVTPDDGRKFSELYNVQHLKTNSFDPVNKVVITTIQRLYSMLSGDPDYDAEKEEESLFELGSALDRQAPKVVTYNPRLSIEDFDFIVIDECHRSIYTLWRQVLEYFDAFLIGLTATPSNRTFGFFNQNLVMEYPRARAVAEGINVDSQVFRVRTAITEGGSTIEALEIVKRRDRRTRAERWETLDEDLPYDPNQLDRDVVSESQIRTVLRVYRDNLFTVLFPGRNEVPKTLIFAKDDSHAEDIVRLTREEFGKGNDFCKKITYSVHREKGVKADDLIRDFRSSYFPRIAVTVDMIATGTDIKPLEVLLFMRSVKSRVLFEQMLGRGTRIINPTDLQAVTPDAASKDRFFIVDAVGVVEQEKVDLQPVERKRSVPFDKLLQSVALGLHDEDTLVSLAGRLGRLERTLSAQDADAIRAASGGLDLRQLSSGLLDAFDPDRQFAAAHSTGIPDPTPAQLDNIEATLADEACAPFDNPALRDLLNTIQRRNEVTIDTVSIDRVLDAGFSQADTDRARSTVESFEQFLAANRDKITALQIIYNRPYSQQRLDYSQIKELAAALQQPPYNLTPDALWQAYARLEGNRVRRATGQRVLTDLVSLLLHALHIEEDLVPYPELVRRRYQSWLAQQQATGRTFSETQRWWLDHIAEQIGVNLTLQPKDLDYGEFQARGGRVAALRTLGPNWIKLLDELNTALAA